MKMVLGVSIIINFFLSTYTDSINTTLHIELPQSLKAVEVPQIGG